MRMRTCNAPRILVPQVHNTLRARDTVYAGTSTQREVSGLLGRQNVATILLHLQSQALFLVCCNLTIKIRRSIETSAILYSNIKFRNNPFSGSRVFSMRTDEQTDGHDEANSRFSQFCERAE